LAAPWRRARVRVAPGLTAHGDAQLLRIAVANLLENAWKFTSRRAMSVIEVGRHAQDAQHDVFFVRDNGCGFDMAQADGLFHRFHRLHHADEYPGTGLGLVTVNRVLARHGGRIWAEAAPDAGSTFFFSLPHPADAQRRAAAPALSGTDE
jgi:light-regulated signal transduction histidine kinase (bacteriophytochrome)